MVGECDGSKCDAGSLAFFVGFGWLGWGFWLYGSIKSHPAATIFGLAAVGLILVVLTMFCIKQLAYFALYVLALPFLIIWAIVKLGVNLLLLILSSICVITLPPCFRITATSKGDYCRLCHKCDIIIERSRLLLGSPWILTLSVEKRAFYSRSDLEKSAPGCHLCQILLASVVRFNKRENVTSTNSSLPKQGKSNKSNIEVAAPDDNSSNGFPDITVRIWMRRYLWNSPTLHIQLRGASILKSKPVDIAWITKDGFWHRCYESVDTGSDDISSWAKKWVEDCTKNHELCQNEFVPSSQKEYLPLRLLDVQDPEGTADTVRLVSTVDLEPDSQVSYCALSHCWGGTVDVMLTKDNRDTMKIVQTHTLPRNFQDAVAITRQLGIRYLWIDSLAICQGDTEEWELQSTKMGLVYANAKCVISATASKDSTGGCFLHRALKYNACVLRVRGNKLLVAGPSEKTPGLPYLFADLVQRAPLTTRGWTFQERYLAGRTLHYCDGAVLFECDTLTASEYQRNGEKYLVKPSIRSDGRLHSQPDVEEVETYRGQWTISPPMHRPYKGNAGAWKRWAKKARIDPRYTAQQEKKALMLKESARVGVRAAFEVLWRFKGETLLEKIEFHNSWFELVQLYSVRKLTQGTDKAMAIAGVAYFVQQNTGLKYAAGLWREMLPFNLLWFVSGGLGLRPDRFVQDHLVPSWSWTSVDGKISHRLSDRKDEGRAHTGTDAGYERTFRCSWEDVNPLITDETLVDEGAINGLVHNATLKLHGHICKLDADKINITFDTRDHSALEELYCLPVLSLKNVHPSIEIKSTQIHGIILRTAVNAKAEACYERVGYFWTVDQSVVDALRMYRNQISTIEIV
ncbi:hypothetical protein G7Y89_g11101 [Cudoniella acicularis]|uniref:Heterokaryon incompatibility domain-containing protein n=1 Tax=Cudoniella acicularis TaxID=354080 RepID=A0A8H4VYC6_9HELO|nr:hypothetical protein G7Y89_g11101 [Cudoniella acicularis]